MIAFSTCCEIEDAHKRFFLFRWMWEQSFNFEALSTSKSKIDTQHKLIHYSQVAIINFNKKKLFLNCKMTNGKNKFFPKKQQQWKNIKQQAETSKTGL